MRATIWHNPRCSKSRAALAILEQAPDVDVEVVEYLKTPPSRVEIEAVLDAMAAHPILIERAIVITDKGVVIARPPERVHEIL